MPPQMPMIEPRRSAGNAFVKIVRASGVTAAEPMPWIARAVMSSAAFGATAHKADATVNSARPAT